MQNALASTTWWCQTHAMRYPHNVTGRMPDGRRLTDHDRRHPCRPIETLAPAAEEA